jgi:Tfp pilus assembly protein PilF
MLTLARLYSASNKYKEAREVLEKARKVKELDPEVHELIAEVMVLQNQPTSAFDEFRMAVSNLHLKD